MHTPGDPPRKDRPRMPLAACILDSVVYTPGFTTAAVQHTLSSSVGVTQVWTTASFVSGGWECEVIPYSSYRCCWVGTLLIAL
jgi:hypothetical protein